MNRKEYFLLEVLFMSTNRPVEAHAGQQQWIAGLAPLWADMVEEAASGEHGCKSHVA